MSRSLALCSTACYRYQEILSHYSSAYITPLASSGKRIAFQILCQTFKCTDGLVHSYLSDLVVKKTISNLCSENQLEFL